MSLFRRLVAFALVQMMLEVAAVAVLLIVLQALLSLLSTTFLQSTFGATLTNILYACAIFDVLFLASRWLEHRPLSEMGLPRQQWGSPLLLGFLFGGGLMGAVIFVLAVTGCYHITSIEPLHAIQLVVLIVASGLLSLLLLRNKGTRRRGFFQYLFLILLGFGLLPVAASLLLLLAAAIQEELVFRGMIFRLLERALGSWIAVILSALAFGALHILNPGATLVSTLAITLTAGVIMAAIYLLTRSLWWVIGLHLGWNFFEGPVFGAQVSGHSVYGGFFSASLTGPQAWTGGAFGPEAGLVAILIVGSVGLLLCIRAARQHRLVKPH
jgi:membrane protease YdiL (CAAX protease family)